MMELLPVNGISREDAERSARAVLEKKFPCRVLSARYVGGGSFGYVWICAIDREPGQVVMKACRTDGMCEREARELTVLGADTLVPVPRVYFTALADEETPIDFLCMEVMAGGSCAFDKKALLRSPSRKRRFAEQVTQAQYHWHRITNDRFGLLEDPHYDGWFDFYAPRAEEILKTAETLTAAGKLQPSVLETMRRAYRSFDRIFSEPVTRAGLIHGDLNTANIMVDSSLNLTAIIDPLEVRWADTEFDLFQLRNLTGEAFGLYQTYKKNYPTSNKVDSKTAFYALFHEVYCYILSGQKLDFILLPLVERMRKELKKAGY